MAPTMPVVYFLSGRENVSRYDLTIPGDVEGARIIETLETSQTRCIIYNPVMYPEFRPFHELFPELSRYLQQHYRAATKIRGGGQIWLGMVRKSVGQRDALEAIP
ncbi:MAG: hypothetical protein JRG94_02005 [Deltaproteobacteria bacterium]|nr:hypothetical protein [Deltaproteobacteria bacterium]